MKKTNEYMFILVTDSKKDILITEISFFDKEISETTVGMVLVRGLY
jgi:hypothetical protein